MSEMSDRVAKAVLASRMCQGWQVGTMEVIREGRGVKSLLTNAGRQLESLSRYCKEGELCGLVSAAQDALDNAVEAVEKLIGVGASEQMNRETGFLSSEKRAALRWANIAAMRKDIDAMGEQCEDLLEKEDLIDHDGTITMKYSKSYETAIDALNSCSRSLSHVEHLI